MERARPAEIESLMESMTPEECKILERFREAAPVKYNDHVLARFLRARKFDFNKAMEMYNKYLEFRTQNDLEHIEEFEFPELQALKEVYPHGFHKTDRFGRLIYIERYCSIDMKRIFEITTEERMMRYYIREYESMVTIRMPSCCVAAGYTVEQSLTILDLGGSSTKLMKKSVYKFVKLASGIAQDYYPEVLGKMFIINSPTLFSIAWKVIRPWIDERTQKKITIEGSKYQAKLLQIVAPENLPDFLGGTCSCQGGCLNSNMGPWSDPEIRRRVRETDSRL